MRVIVRTKKGTMVNRVTCENDHFTIGSSADSLIALNGWKIAPAHAAIRKQENQIFVKDLGSKTGTFVDGAKVTEAYRQVLIGQKIEIGDYWVEIADSGSASSQPSIVPNETDLSASPSQTENVRVLPVELVECNPETLNIEKEWRSRIHKQLIDTIDLRRINVSEMDDASLRDLTKGIIDEALSKARDFPESRIEKKKIAKQVLEEAVGLGPLEDLIGRQDISEIMVNAFDEIYFECQGKILKSPITFSNNKAVLSAIERIVAPLGRRIDESSPMVDARLKDGSRVNAIIPPLALKGPCITIRKFMKEKLTADRLMEFGSVSSQMVAFAKLAVEHKLNVVISGGTGSGKTTLLNVLSNFIPEDERIVTIEDAAELKLNQPHIVSLEARPPNQEGKGAVAIRDLVKNSLRMRPDRIVVGECRGGEALDMLQAMNTGHDGSMTTIHSNSPRDCVARMEVLVLMSGMDLPVKAIREQIASAVNIIVQQTRFACGSRKVTSIAEVTGMEGDIVQIAEIFSFTQTGFDEKGRVLGRFISTGVIPEFCEKMARRGIPIDLSIFDRKGG